VANPSSESNVPGKLGPNRTGKDTAGAAYAERLERLETTPWKQVLDVQAPYRWNIRRLNLGRTLEIGCGIGRNLEHLAGNGVGVDHNPVSIAAARRRGFQAFTVEDFHASEYARPGAFDSLLLAHVAEHVGEPEAVAIVQEYLGYLRTAGNVVFICPQEKGYTTDETHVRFCGFPELRRLAGLLGLMVEREYSFPLPRLAGKVFPYNEFVVLASKP